jgi:serine/threonine-protein kinase
MVIDSVDTLLAVLRRTQLLASPQVEEIARELAPHYADPFELSDYLIEIDWLTAYQRRLLFEGRWNELSFGSYQVMDRLGEGAVGEVFKAWDTVRGRVVALKVLRQHLTVRPEALQQLQREQHAVIHLSHPNIIKTYDVSQVGEQHYFAMEYVEGLDLRRYVERYGPLPVEQACNYARQAALGLQHAHQEGLVHRDVKPANLFLLNPPLPDAPAVEARRRNPEPVVKILDWGLARLKPAQGTTADSTFDLDAEKGLLIGTADYIAPEQAQDATLVDARADIYSLGCVLYFLLTGRPPFAGPSLIQKLMQHREEPPPALPAQGPDAPDDLNAVLQRMMAKQPEQRFQIPLLAAAALRRFCGGVGLAGLAGTAGGAAFRPASSASMLRPSSKVHVARPGSAEALARPETAPALGRPSTAVNLQRPATNPNGYPPLGR